MKIADRDSHLTDLENCCDDLNNSLLKAEKKLNMLDSFESRQLNLSFDGQQWKISDKNGVIAVDFDLWRVMEKI